MDRSNRYSISNGIALIVLLACILAIIFSFPVDQKMILGFIAVLACAELLD